MHIDVRHHQPRAIDTTGSHWTASRVIMRVATRMAISDPPGTSALVITLSVLAGTAADPRCRR
ncbi:MAG TPA: hypothetical protein VGL92_13440 [Acidimicrobiia bacterium]